MTRISPAERSWFVRDCGQLCTRASIVTTICHVVSSYAARTKLHCLVSAVARSTRHDSIPARINTEFVITFPLISRLTLSFREISLRALTSRLSTVLSTILFDSNLFHRVPPISFIDRPFRNDRFELGLGRPVSQVRKKKRRRKMINFVASRLHGGDLYLFNFGLTTAVQQLGYNLVSWSCTEKRDLSSRLLTYITPWPLLANIYVFKARRLYPCWPSRNGRVTSPCSQTHHPPTAQIRIAPYGISFASNFENSLFPFLSTRSVSFNVNQ